MHTPLLHRGPTWGLESGAVDPGYFADPDYVGFDAAWVDGWIHELADADYPDKFFADEKLDIRDYSDHLESLLHSLAMAYTKSPEKFAELHGYVFARAMTPMAASVFDEREKNQSQDQGE